MTEEEPTPSGTDRRQQERTKIEIKRTILASVEDEGIKQRGCHLHLLDISEGGMRVNIDQALEPEARLKLRFDIGALGTHLEGHFESVCRVVWTKPTPGGTITGFEFKELSKEARVGLQHLLDFWGNKSSLELVRLWKPVNAKLRNTEAEPWSQTLFVQALSLKGFQFNSPRPVDREHALQSRLLLNDGPVITPVKVLWCKQISDRCYDTGCQFEDLSSEQTVSVRLHLKRTGNASFRK